MTLYSAVPVSAGRQVLGAVLVSQSTYRILRDLYAIRLDIAKVFLVQPRRRRGPVPPPRPHDRRAAEAAGRGRRGALGGAAAAAGEAASAFPESRRSDEIGDLQRSLRSLVAAPRRAGAPDRALRRRRGPRVPQSPGGYPQRRRARRAGVDGGRPLALPPGHHRGRRAPALHHRRPQAPLPRREPGASAEGRPEPRSTRSTRPARPASGSAPGSRARARLIVLSRSRARGALALLADPAALDVILDNLVGNAASFAGARCGSRSSAGEWAGQGSGRGASSPSRSRTTGRASRRAPGQGLRPILHLEAGRGAGLPHGPRPLPRPGPREVAGRRHRGRQRSGWYWRAFRAATFPAMTRLCHIFAAIGC